jgi:PAS domain S-box-containing protein
MPSFSLSGEHTSAWLAGLLDSAMDAIITVDEGYRIVLYNHAAERIFGWPAGEMHGQPLGRLIPARFHGVHDRHMERFARTGATARRMSGSSVVYGVRSTGEEFPVDASISQLETREGRFFTVILRDVTERMEAEREQARLAARLSGLLDSAMDGIITVDEHQRVVLYNRAAERIFGWPASQVMGRTLDMLMPRRFRAEHRAHVERFGATGVSSRRMGGNLLILGLRASGEEFPIDASISQVDTAEGKLYSVIVRDVTERVRAQEELAAFAAEASGVREQEKARIARELHDELAQALTALKMDTTWLIANPEEREAGHAKLTGMLSLLDHAVASTRRIAADLRPLVLDDLGLLAALEWLAQSFTQRTGVPCRMELDESLDLQEPFATAVFRIVQESLANVGKHAQAHHVDVRLAQAGEEVVLVVKDDGIGFQTSDPRKPQSIGLVGLRERARLLRGSVAIQSEPGKGTRVEARLPLPQAA